MTAEPVAFVLWLPTIPHCPDTVQQAWRVGPVLRVYMGSFNFWLNVLKGKLLVLSEGKDYGLYGVCSIDSVPKAIFTIWIRSNFC